MTLRSPVTLLDLLGSDYSRMESKIHTFKDSKTVENFLGTLIQNHVRGAKFTYLIIIGKSYVKYRTPLMSLATDIVALW